MSHTIRTVLGVILLILAGIGAVLPFVQGWLFFAAAVAVLGTDHVITKWCFRQMERGKQWVLRFRKKKDPDPRV
jgi:protein-S-isoprenylcysteine O-methyltransferase Ste14